VLNTCFEQKFATGSYGVGIGRAWYSRKACEICSSLVQKKKLKKNYFSSQKLPKQQSTIFWSQGILGVKNKRISCRDCMSNFIYIKNDEEKVKNILISLVFHLILYKWLLKIEKQEFIEFNCYTMLPFRL
jgi:hypothetical protein